MIVQSMPPVPVPVLGGVTTGCCPPVGGATGGGSDDGGCSAAGVSVGSGVGVFVKGLRVGVDVGHPPSGQGVFVTVGVGGNEVFVAVGTASPLFVSVAPKHSPIELVG